MTGTTRDVEDRLETKAAYFGADHDGDLCRDAAAEIRRLRSERDEAATRCHALAEQWEAQNDRANRAEAELERRDAALREAVKDLNNARRYLGQAIREKKKGTAIIENADAIMFGVQGRLQALATGGDDE